MFRGWRNALTPRSVPAPCPPPVHARQELRGLHASTLFVLLPWTLEHNLCLSRSAHLLSNGLAAGLSGSSWLPGASGHKRSL